MSNTALIPENFQHRSFIYRKFDPLQVTWSESNGYATVSSIVEPKIETTSAQHLAICDLSHLQRVGLKGAGTCKWLESQNIQIPAKVNNALPNENGCIVAKLGFNEILIFDSLQNNTNTPKKLERQWNQHYSRGNNHCGYIVPRQESHACFFVTGRYSYEMFAKLCAIDLREEKFPNHTIAQTSLARLGAIIIRNDLNNIISYIVLVESASAEYCWDCILDAIYEFNGKIIGTSALLTITS